VFCLQAAHWSNLKITDTCILTVYQLSTTVPALIPAILYIGALKSHSRIFQIRVANFLYVHGF
jgi:hypothetical protein